MRLLQQWNINELNTLMLTTMTQWINIQFLFTCIKWMANAFEIPFWNWYFKPLNNCNHVQLINLFTYRIRMFEFLIHKATCSRTKWIQIYTFISQRAWQQQFASIIINLHISHDTKINSTFFFATIYIIWLCSVPLYLID